MEEGNRTLPNTPNMKTRVENNLRLFADNIMTATLFVNNNMTTSWGRRPRSKMASWKISLALLFMLHRCTIALIAPISRAPAFFVSSKVQQGDASLSFHRSSKHAKTSGGLLSFSYPSNRPFVSYYLQSSQQDQHEKDDDSFFLQASRKAAKDRIELLQEGKDPLKEFVASTSSRKAKIVEDVERSTPTDQTRTEAIEIDKSDSNVDLETETKDQGSEDDLSREGSDAAKPSPVLQDDSYADLISSIPQSPLSLSLGFQGNALDKIARDDDTTSTETPNGKRDEVAAYNFQRKLLESRLALEKKAKESMPKTIKIEAAIEASYLTQKTKQISPPSEPEAESEQPVIVEGMTAAEPDDDTFFINASQQAAKIRSELMKEGKDPIALTVGSAPESLSIQKEISSNEMDSIDVAKADASTDELKTTVPLPPSQVVTGSDNDLNGSSPAENSKLLPEKPGSIPELAVEETHETATEATNFNDKIIVEKGLSTELREQSSSEKEIDPEKVGMGLLILTRSLLALKQIVDKE